MLSSRVIAKSVRPRAKPTSDWGPAKSLSPVSWLTMVTVTVETGSAGLARRTGLLPAARTTIMVSPIARLTARRKAPTIPGSAAGRSTRRMPSEGVAPSAREPSRRDKGTWRRMSSEREEMKGISMMPITRPAVRALVARMSMPMAAPTVERNGPTVTRAKKP